jgi:lipopolysaccharide export system permease protein
MTMLALPFVLGSLRSAGAGARMVIGLVIGLGYYVLGELSANTGQVFALDPVVAAWAPSSVLLIITMLAVVRLR